MKTYIKPLAMNVTFSVNENIAASFDAEIDVRGSFSYEKGNVAGKCNKYINNTKIESGLPYGEENADVTAAIDYCWKNGTFGQIWGMVQTNPETGASEFICY